VINRRGTVLADRYHAHVLRTPTETRRAVRYVRNNGVKHATVARVEHDVYASHAADVALPAPHTWLLREGWRRAPP